MSVPGLVNFVGVTLAASTTRTMVQLLAGTNHPIRIDAWGIGFDSVAAADEPIEVGLIIQTSAGTSSSATVRPVNRPQSVTFDTSALTGFSGTEPTDGGVEYGRRLIHPAGGFEIWYPVGKEIIVATAERIGLRCISGSLSASLTKVAGFIQFDE